MTDEVWAEVVDFPDYIVSNTGRVVNRHTNRELRGRINSYGYARVGLRRDGKTVDVYIHHLVAKTFITGYRWGVRIRHHEHNEDNSVQNLRFLGRRMGTVRKNLPRATSRRIRIVETDEIFLTVENCAKYLGTDPASIYRVLRGERDSHRGYSYEYVYEER